MSSRQTCRWQHIPKNGLKPSLPVAPDLDALSGKRTAREDRSRAELPLDVLPRPERIAQSHDARVCCPKPPIKQRILLHCHLGHTVSCPRPQRMILGNRQGVGVSVYCAAEDANVIGIFGKPRSASRRRTVPVTFVSRSASGS